jgi:eukaryotic-like serine/threonine-protein kinase
MTHDEAMEEVLAKIAPLQAGEMLGGKYRVVRQLGEGGMGIVYEAHHPLLQKPVAIKVLRPELARVEERRDRFEAEARATAAIGHPNIVAVTDMGETPEGALYFVMDRLNGETLAERLLRLGKLDIRSAAVVALDVLAGLEAAHALMLVHRDLKPDNIFMAKMTAGREIAKILDFGIAKALAGAGKRRSGTQLGFTVGTPMYMAPEQALADTNIDARADLWALGVIVYEMISGRPPFQSEDTVEVLTRVVSGNRAPLAAVCPEAPPALVELIESALSAERAKRPATAGEFAARLQQAVFGTATPSPGMITGGSMARIAEANLGALDRPELVELEPLVLASRAGPAASAPLPRPVPSQPAQPTPAPAPSPGNGAAAPEEAGPELVELVFARPRPRRKTTLVASLVVLCLAAGGAVALVKAKPEVLESTPLLKHPAALLKGLMAGDPKPAKAGDVADVVWVTFNVVPPHSKIYVDGQPIPSNPAPLTRGQIHNVTAIADGYEIEQMDIKGTSVGTIHMRLEKKKPRRR